MRDATTGQGVVWCIFFSETCLVSDFHSNEKFVLLLFGLQLCGRVASGTVAKMKWRRDRCLKF